MSDFPGYEVVGIEYLRAGVLTVDDAEFEIIINADGTFRDVVSNTPPLSRRPRRSFDPMELGRVAEKGMAFCSSETSFRTTTRRRL